MLLPSVAQEKWQYTAFPYVAKNSPLKKNEPEVLKVGSKKLRALMSRQSATHRYWGVEQVYLSSDLKKKLFVKYKVQLNSKKPLGGWLKMNKGHVLHLQKGKDVVAYMAQGFNNLELYELQKQLQVVKVAEATPWFNPWMSCSHADEVTTDAMGNIAYSPEASVAPESASPSMLARAGSVMTCVGAETIDAAIESGKALWENASWENVKSGVGNAASAAWEAVPSVEEVGAGFKATGNFIAKAWNEPAAAWADVTGRFDKTVEVVAQLGQELAKSLKNFHFLSIETQDRLICDLISEMAKKKVLSAALAAVASAGAVTAYALSQAFTFVRQYSKKMAILMRAISMIDGSAVAMDAKMDQLDLLLSGKMPQHEIRLLETGGRTPSAVSVAGAGSKYASPYKAMAPEQLAVAQARNRALADTQRLVEVEKMMGRTLTPAEKSKLLAIHNLDCAKTKCTAQEIRDRKDLAGVRDMFPGSSPEQIKDLYRSGLLGREVDYAEVYKKAVPDVRTSSYGRARDVPTDVSAAEVPAVAKGIREGLDSGMLRPESDGKASHLGTILLRDFAKSPTKDGAAKLENHLEKLGYPAPTASGLKWPLNTESAMDNLMRVPVDANPARLLQLRGTSQYTVMQISERLSVLSDPIRRRGLDLSESEAASMIRTLREQKQKIESNILMIDGKLSSP